MSVKVNLLLGPTRARLLRALGEGPANADQLAEQVGLHRTVVHAHLRRLREAGFVEVASTIPPRGRPRHTYRLAHDAVELSWPSRQHRLLAILLGNALQSNAADPQRAAKRSGVACARALDLQRLDDMVALGWRYHHDDSLLACQSCAFQEACQASDGIPCHVHAGLLQVVLHRPVEPSFRTETGCRFRLGEGEVPYPSDVMGAPS